MDFITDYIANQYEITWLELSCLSRALGYPSKLLIWLFHCGENGTVQIRNIFKIVESPKFLSILDTIYNRYTGRWNANLILTSIFLLVHKSISFKELNDLRILYQFFELPDGRGMSLNIPQLLKLLRLSGRCIAPDKLAHRIKHMHSRLSERLRIQFSELLELIIWTDVYVEAKSAFEGMKMNNENGLYQTHADPDISFEFLDLELLDEKSKQYQLEECAFIPGSIKKITRLVHHPLIYQSSTRLSGDISSALLRRKLINSNFQVQRAQSGICRPTKIKEKRCQTPNLIDEPIPVQPNRPKTAPIVTRDEIIEQQRLIQQCEQDTKNLKSKYQQIKDGDIEFMSPGHWRRCIQNQPKHHHHHKSNIDLLDRRNQFRLKMIQLSRPSTKESTLFHKNCF